jgi:hypothetical protein
METGMTTSGKFVFRKNAVLGAAAAEDDAAFLQECFVDNGDLQTLSDPKDHRRIVLGRTGSGKSALLLKLKELGQTIWIEPQTLSLNYIANSNVLQFFEAAGVNLTPFYKLLWKHVLTVELLRRHYHLDEEAKAKTFLQKLFGALSTSDAKTKKVMKYLSEYGDKFWEGTEFRIKDIVTKVEKELTGSAGFDIGHAKVQGGGKSSLSEEQRKEVVQRGQEVVSRFQVRDLQDVLEVLADDLLKGARGYNVVIDGLDENWVDDAIRYQLIRALIDTVREFKRVSQVKIIVGLRHDLLETVLNATRDKGFQEEKYLSLCLHITWTKDQLIKLVNARINKLVKDAYTTSKVTHDDVLPETKGGVSYIHPMLARTTLRPRDIILFFNECMSRSEGKPRIAKQTIDDAEVEYSRGRLAALADEWQSLYPGLADFTRLFKDRKPSMILGEIPDDIIGEFCLGFVIKHHELAGPLCELAKRLAEDKIKPTEFRVSLCCALYRVGFLAIKPAAADKFQWIHETHFSLAAPAVTDDTRVQVHPAYWRALHINPMSLAD